MKLWPYIRKVERIGTEKWKAQQTYGGVPIGEPSYYDRDFAVYHITNQWTGSVKLKKVFLDS